MAEMLIVIAIIGVLIAIVYVSLSNVLENSREAVDMANIRGAYSQLQAALIDDSSIPTVVFKKTEASKYQGKVVKVSSSVDDSKVIAGSYLISVQIKQTKKGWQSLDNGKLVIGNFSWTPDANIEGTTKYRCLYIVMDANGKIIQKARGK